MKNEKGHTVCNLCDNHLCDKPVRYPIGLPFEEDSDVCLDCVDGNVGVFDFRDPPADNIGE